MGVRGQGLVDDVRARFYQLAGDEEPGEERGGSTHNTMPTRCAYSSILSSPACCGGGAATLKANSDDTLWSELISYLHVPDGH